MKKIVAYILIMSCLSSGTLYAGSKKCLRISSANDIQSLVIKNDKNYKISFTNGAVVEVKGTNLSKVGGKLGVRTRADDEMKYYTHAQISNICSADIKQETYWLRGMAIGASVGGAVGVGAGLGLAQLCESDGRANCRVIFPFLGLVGLGTIGAGAGALIGHSFPKNPVEVSVAPIFYKGDEGTVAGLGVAGKF